MKKILTLFFSDPSKGYKGITAFIVEKEWGVEIAKKEKKASAQ
jgi:alkylation response protein AidB-like acyl-CoA dehydrogenase